MIRLLTGLSARQFRGLVIFHGIPPKCMEHFLYTHLKLCFPIPKATKILSKISSSKLLQIIINVIKKFRI